LELKKLSTVKFIDKVTQILRKKVTYMVEKLIKIDEE